MVFEITRREFLLVNAAAGLTTLAPTLFGASPGPELTSQERNALLVVTRTLFSHDHLDDGLYVKAVGAIEARCRADLSISRLVTSGIAMLNAVCVGAFADAGKLKCINSLKTMEKSAFFQIVYAETLEVLYGSTETWTIFAASSPARGDRQ